MPKKFALSWVSSGLLITMATVNLAQAAGFEVKLSGYVRFEDGQAVQGGTVIVRELTGPVGKMPDVRYVAVRSTDSSGYFYVDIEDIQGSLHVELVPDRCDWLSDYVTISIESLQKSASSSIGLTPQRENCQRHN